MALELEKFAIPFLILFDWYTGRIKYGIKTYLFIIVTAIINLKKLVAVFCFILLGFTSVSLADSNARIKNFIIKENLLKNDKIAVIAADENETPLEITGKYLFSINGFKQELSFNDGVAITPQPIEKSNFI